MRAPSYTYNEFKQVWSKLLTDNRASLDNAVSILGGSKGTASKYRTQYEVEQKDEALKFVNSIELPEKVIEALANLNVKKIKVLEENNTTLTKHLVDAELSLEALTTELNNIQQTLRDEKKDFEKKNLGYEKQIAVLEARLAERDKSEARLNSELSTLRETLAEASTSVAVAKKEVELLQAQVDKTH